MIRRRIKLFVCLECGKIFSIPTKYKEDRGECFGVPAFEEFSGSPCCAGAYTEAHRCDCCGEWITGEYIKTSTGERFCDNCIRSYELGEEEG